MREGSYRTREGSYRTREGFLGRAEPACPPRTGFSPEVARAGKGRWAMADRGSWHRQPQPGGGPLTFRGRWARTEAC